MVKCGHRCRIDGVFGAGKDRAYPGLGEVGSHECLNIWHFFLQGPSICGMTHLSGWVIAMPVWPPMAGPRRAGV